MPPRRSSRASSSRLFDGSSEAGGPVDTVPSPSMRNAVAGRGMSPGPSKFSSAYGSPPTIMPTRQNVARHRYNFASALSHVIDAVDKDNENDARARAEREAEERRQKLEAERALEAQEEEEVSRQLQEETEESVDLVQGPAAEEEQTVPAPSRRSRSPRRTRTSSQQSSASASKEHSPERRSSDRATAPASASASASASPAQSFGEEDRVFAEAQIVTPVMPSRMGSSIASRTSNIVQNLLNSARRFSTIREEPEDEAVRHAYPHLSFIHPRANNAPPQPPPQEEPPHEPLHEPPHAVPEPPPLRRSTRSSTSDSSRETTDQETDKAPDGPAVAGRRGGLRGLKSRIATPGPRVRIPKNVSKPDSDASPDELAESPEATTTTAAAAAAARSGLRSRRRVQQFTAESIAEETHRRLTVAPLATPAASTRTSEQPERVVASKSQSTWAQNLWAFVQSVSELTKALAMAITLLVLGLVAVRVYVVTTSSAELYDAYRVDNRLHWYGSDWRSNLRQLVPFALVHPLGAISDEEFARMNGLILSHANEVAQMRHAQRLQGDALRQIDRILPAVVHMELDRQGRPVIAQEFWHALKDHVLADRDIFSLIRRKDGSLAVSDLQWAALRRQLEASGMLPDPHVTKALTVRDVESIAEGTLSKSWEAWLRRNQNKVRDMLGVGTDTPPQQRSQPSPPQPDTALEHLSEAQLVRLAQQMAASERARAVIVPKQEFLQILQNSFVEHRVEIKGELAELEARVVELARAAAEAVVAAAAAASTSVQPGPTGSPAVGGDEKASGAAATASMTKREMAQLVDQLVRKGISDAQLEAMARGKIKADWNANLVRQVNFFSRNAGATFNHHFSSPSYMPVRPPFWKRRPGRRFGSGTDASGRHEDETLMQGRPVPGSLRGSAAFEPWEQDGDCWCATTGGKGKGNKASKGTADIAVKLGLRVVPQHLVVEHISPSATLDPGAMPKDLEVWAQITDYAAQRPLQDWSLSQFPGTDPHSPLLGWGFVQIGAFTFDSRASSSSSSTGGSIVQVFRLSPELEALEAVTDHVLVRATSNHGDTDHTCFYRVRLYGQPRPDVVE